MTYSWKWARLASGFLAAGFFVLSACTTTQSMADRKESDDSRLPSEEQLRSLDRQISESEQPGPLLIDRMELLQQFARNSEPDQRQLYYEEMVQTTRDPDLQEEPWTSEAEDRLTAAYESEFEAGENALSEDPSTSREHFRNASTLQPGEGDPYRHLSSLYYREDRIPEAISLLQRANQQMSSFPVDLHERLAFLLLESGEMEPAISHYKELVRQAPDQTEIRHALVNAYILNENHTEAVGELRTLLELAPDESQYRQSLATELFFHLQDHWRATPPSEQNEEEIRSDLEWMDEAIELLEQSEPESSGLEEAYRLAQFYRNSGIYLLREAQTLPDRPATELVSRGEYLLKEAVPHWQQLTDQNPENRELWLHLQEIYQELGLDDQARQIEEQMESQATES